ncbi:MAG: DUF4386 domain-containing protein [Actinomycetota bacterium]|nr:DUF4386 domain-containing protein [Actinomycetota bacterium]
MSHRPESRVKGGCDPAENDPAHAGCRARRQRTPTSIAALLLYEPVLNEVGYITGAGSDTRVSLGALLELILIIANIGTSVVLFPVLASIHRSASAAD